MATKCLREQELAVEHLSSMVNIKTAKCCLNCPLRLYARKDDKIIFGCGNIITDTIMILPSYDVKAGIGYNTILNITQNVYKDITGRELLEEYYVTRAIKCLNKTDYVFEKQAVNSCISNLWYEIGRIKPKQVIVFDKYVYEVLEINCRRLGIGIKTNMNPGVMYYDNESLKKIFYEEFKRSLL